MAMGYSGRFGHDLTCFEKSKTWTSLKKVGGLGCLWWKGGTPPTTMMSEPEISLNSLKIVMVFTTTDNIHTASGPPIGLSCHKGIKPAKLRKKI